ncbi:MAG: hypothetical protein D6696_18235 [Acidobacteria bacterium]|nr:MAG: hypothetical protein D6696_18235 [Acidobacteriota bacterium]
MASPPSSPPFGAAPEAGRDRRRDVGFWLFLAHLATVWGIAVSNVFHGLTLLWLGHAWWRRRPRRPRWRWRRVRPLIVPLALYVLLLWLAIALSREPRVSFGHFGEVLTVSTLPLALVLVRGAGAARRVVDVLIGVELLLAVFGIVQYYFTDYGAMDRRIPGPFSHYQTFAGVLMIGALLILARLVTGQRWRRPGLWLAFGLVFWTLMLTLTRGPWLALGLVTAGFLLIYARRVALAAALAVIAGLLLAPAEWRQRASSIGDLSDPSSYDRLCMVEAGLYMIGERPLFGLGPGMVRERYPIYRHPTAPRYTVSHLHNTFLHLAAERGLLALATYLWLMAASLRLAWRGLRRAGGLGGPDADLWLGTILVLAAFNVAGLFEANWRDTEVQRLVLFVLALPLCLRPSSASPPPPARPT